MFGSSSHNRSARLGLAGFACVAAFLWAQVACAQEAVIAGAFDIMSGLEGGGSGHASGVRRARTTLRFAAEGWVDESPEHVFSVGALVELEPRASIGADLRYMRLAGDSFVFHVGGTAIIAPKHMIGASFGVGYRLALGETFKLNVGPTANIYFAGADLPEGQVLWQGMLGAGVRVQF